MLKPRFFVFLHMIRIVSVFLLLFVLYSAQAQQEARLPTDIRQHNLTEYNASLFNPSFSLDRNNPESISLWTRWQWQSIDADPSTIFLSYTRKLNATSAANVAFFQHNTGVFFSTGGVLNYAHAIEFSPLFKLSFGANLFGFKQKLADDRFVTDPLLPQQQVTDDFILQLAPGINLSVENFSFSMASENLIDYNFTSKESNTRASAKIFMGMISYDFPIAMSSDSTAFLRPSLYLRTIPELDNQIGVSTLFSTSKYWGKLGYNNFYGISFGAGGTFLNRMSLGALMEFGTSASLNTKNPSFEIVASYFLGKPDERRKEVAYYLEGDDEMVGKTEEEKIEKQDEVGPQETEVAKLEKKRAKELKAQEKALARERRRDSVAVAKKEKEALAENKKQEEEKTKIAQEQSKKMEELAAAQKLKEQQRLDSIKNVEQAETLARAMQLERQKEQDSINNVKLAETEAAKKMAEEEPVKTAQEAEEIKPEAGEKYEETTTEDGLEPGYYLIANVFGTKKYFDAFMKDLTDKGLNPKSFFRSKNKYNYTYLGRYDTMAEARKARDSKLGGRYQGKTWIFRVVGE